MFRITFSEFKVYPTISQHLSHSADKRDFYPHFHVILQKLYTCKLTIQNSPSKPKGFEPLKTSYPSADWQKDIKAPKICYQINQAHSLSFVQPRTRFEKKVVKLFKTHEIFFFINKSYDELVGDLWPNEAKS